MSSKNGNERARAGFAILACAITACAVEGPAPRHAEPVMEESPVARSAAPAPDAAAPAATAAPPSVAETPPAAEPPAASPPPSGGLPRSLPTIATAGAATCRVGEAHELAVVDRRRTRVAVSFRGDRGLAAWATGEDELRVRPIDRDARPTGASVASAFRRADRLEWLVAMPTGTIALSSGDLCDRFGHSCFQAIALDDEGHALGAFLHKPGNQWASVNATAVGGGWLFALQEGRWGSEVVRYRIGDDRSLNVESGMGLRLDGSTTGDIPLRAVAASPTGRAFVLVDHEGQRGRVTRLYDWESQRMLPLMRGFGQDPDGVAVDLMEVDGDAIVIVADRKYSRVGFDGRVLVGPERIRDRAALPEGLRDRMIVSVESRRGQTVLVRRDLARAEVGGVVSIARSPSRPWYAPYAHAAWVGDRFVVVAGEPAENGIRVTSRTVECGSAR